MNRADEMEAWLRDKQARTVEERFGAEVIMERVHRAFFAKKGWQWECTWEEERQQKKARKFNPAYRPSIHYGVLRDRVASIAEEITVLHVDCADDRYVRDVSFLQFFPNIKDLHLTGGALRSLEPLQHLPKLELLMISDHELEDFRPVSACRNVKKLYLSTYMPWPVLPNFAGLNQLTFFNWRGNMLLLEEVPLLAALEKAEFHNGYGTSTPLRDFRKLPEMPQLRFLQIGQVARLEGVERFPKLINLEVEGRFTDLSPLSRLPCLTHLTINRSDVIHSDLTLDVSPLAQMPELRELEMITDQPIDFSPLAEAPRLRQISRKGFHVRDENLNAMELKTINAVLTPWDEEYALPEPRPLPSPVFKAIEDIHKVLGDEARIQALQAESEQNPRLFASEQSWIARKLNSVLNKLLGKKWGKTHASIDPLVYVHSLEAAEQMPQIVQAIRETLAWSRRERHAVVVVDLNAEWETKGDEWDPDADFKREYADHLHMKKEIAERKAYLERLHQVRLRQQEGVPTDPANFAPDDTPAVETRADDPPQEADEGDVAVYEERQKEHPMAEVLWSRLWVCEAGAFVSHREQAAMEHLMGRKADT